MKLTQALVDGLPLAPKGVKTAIITRDSVLRGFYVAANGGSKSYHIQADLRRGGRKVRTIRAKVGTVGQMTLRDARLAGAKLLARIKQGQELSAPGDGVTLAGAWQRYQEVGPGRVLADRTLPYYQRLLDDHLHPLMDRALRGIDPAEMQDLHLKISTTRGPAVANQAMKIFRAIYRFARRADRTLPETPTLAVHFNKETKCKTIVTDMLGWAAQVRAMANPHQRDLHIAVMLTGLRKTSACLARWSDYDFKTGVLHIPFPKGGATKAFDLPLGAGLQGILLDRWEHRESEFIFPGASGKRIFFRCLPNQVGAHAYRRTFATVATAAGISSGILSALLNHSKADDASAVTAGYISVLPIQARREATQKIEDAIMASVGAIPRVTEQR